MGLLIICLLLFTSSFKIVQPQLSGTFAGPYEVVLKQLAHCDDEGTKELKYNSTKLNKISRDTYSYSGWMYYPYGISDDVKLDVAIYGNGGWKQNYYSINTGGACATFKRFAPSTFKTFLKSINFKGDCPVPKGWYYVNKMNVEFAGLKPIPVLPYHQHRVDLSFLVNKKKVGCFRVFADTVPKKTPLLG